MYWKSASVWFIRASGIRMKPNGLVSKFICTNTVTSSKALLKSHKVFRMDSPKAVLEKSWSEKFHKKLTQKRLLWSPFWSSITTCNFIKEEPHHSYFPILLRRFFRILFYVRKLVKRQKELKYLSAYVLVKSWSEEFHQIHPKETMMDFL